MNQVSRPDLSFLSSRGQTGNSTSGEWRAHEMKTKDPCQARAPSVSFSFQFHIGTFFELVASLDRSERWSLIFGIAARREMEPTRHKTKCQVFGAIARWEVHSTSGARAACKRFSILCARHWECGCGAWAAAKLGTTRKAQNELYTPTPTPHHTSNCSNWLIATLRGSRPSIRTTRSVASDEAVLLCSQAKDVLVVLVICMHPQAADSNGST